MWVQSLGQEDPLEEGMVTHFHILAWIISWTEEPGGLWSIGSQGNIYYGSGTGLDEAMPELGLLPKTKEILNFRNIGFIL